MMEVLDAGTLAGVILINVHDLPRLDDQDDDISADDGDLQYFLDQYMAVSLLKL